MSKIPQGEWNAITARHARGETIARIAHDYGCTAPAIHYILKRQKERTGAVSAGVNAVAAPLVGAPPAMPSPGMRPATELRSAAGLHPVTEMRLPTQPRADAQRRESAPVPAIGLAARAEREEERQRERPEDSRLEPRQPAARGSALVADFDTALQSQIEESIEAFRVNLNAALADRSPMRREELRAAASDLMRMTARTMIVLDRLSAAHEGTPRQNPIPQRPGYVR